MKILAVAFCPPFGVIADLSIRIFEKLSSKSNHEISVLCSKELNIETKNICKSYKINYNKTKPLSLISIESLNIINEIRGQEFDCIFFFSQHILNLPFSMLLKNIKQVMWWHEPQKKGRTTLLKYLLYIPHDYQLTRQAHKIIIACEAMKEMVPEHLQHKIAVVPLPSAFADTPSSVTITEDNTQAQTNFLFFGGIVAYKGLDIFAESISLLLEDGLSPKVKIIGTGNYDKHCPSLLKLSRSYPDNIEIINSFKSEAEIVEIIKNCQTLVLPYLTATGTTTVHVASQQRRPVIATSTGCLQNYIIDGETGWLVPPADSFSLANAMRQVLDDPIRTASMGESAYHHYIENYTHRIIAGKILHLCK